MNKDKYLYIIGGPTASGKTQMAIDLALQWNTEIISADSRQFYKEMNIGTAKPSQEQLNQVPHHFINNLSIHDNYNVGIFETEALALIEKLFDKHDKLIMVGGSGLYIKAITDGLDNFPEIDAEIRKEVRDLYYSQGIEKLQNLIAIKDPEFYSQVDIQNPRRLQRAAEVILQTGHPISKYQKQEPKQRPFQIIQQMIDLPRETLYERINNRVLEMMEMGLEQEARSLYPYRELTTLQTVGYSELFAYFDGTIDLNRAIELIQQNTRRYAKRQMTWFRNDGGWNPV